MFQEPVASKIIDKEPLVVFFWVLWRGGILIKKICELVTEEATVTSI